MKRLMKNLKPRDYFIIMIVVFVIAFYGFYKYAEHTYTQCTDDPLIYGASYLEDAYDMPVTCSCSVPSLKYKPLVFTKDGYQP